MTNHIKKIVIHMHTGEEFKYNTAVQFYYIGELFQVTVVENEKYEHIRHRISDMDSVLIEWK